MIVLLGATGYIGSAFYAEMERRKMDFAAPFRDRNLHSSVYGRSGNVDLVINAAGYTGKPNVDACEQNKMDCMMGNVIMPQMLIKVCAVESVPILHVSSGCIYNGPGPWKEEDPPNFCFDRLPCSWYSGTKALAEDLMTSYGKAWICRLRIPFDEMDGPRNYLSKLLTYPKLINAENSISHRGDFVKACLDLWEAYPAYGTYNMTNPGSVRTDQVAEVLKAHGLKDKFEYFENYADFAETVKAPRSNCVLDVEKLASVGVKMRHVHEAIEDSVKNWKKA